MRRNVREIVSARFCTFAIRRGGGGAAEGLSLTTTAYHKINTRVEAELTETRMSHGHSRIGTITTACPRCCSIFSTNSRKAQHDSVPPQHTLSLVAVVLISAMHNRHLAEQVLRCLRWT